MSDQRPPSEELFQIDRAEFVELLNRQWDANQDLHDEVRRLDGELAATKSAFEQLSVRFDRLALSVGNAGLLVDLAKAVAAVRDNDAPTPGDWQDAFALLARWESNTRPGPD